MDITDEMVVTFESLQKDFGTKGALEYLQELIKVQTIVEKKTREVYG